MKKEQYAVNPHMPADKSAIASAVPMREFFSVNRKMRFIAILAMAVSLVDVLHSAEPVIDQSQVRLVQGGKRRLTVEYVLTGGDGVVTLDIQTNATAGAESGWVSVGPEKVATATGDVFKRVSAGAGTKRIDWYPRNVLPHDIVLPSGSVRAVVKAYPVYSPPDYMVINLDDGSIAYYENVAQLPNGIESDYCRDNALVLRKVHAAGRGFLMGTSPHEVGVPADAYFSYEKTQYVSFTQDYYLGVFEVTCGQFRRVMGKNQVESQFTLATEYRTRPVENVTYVSYGNDTGLMEANAWPNSDFDEARKTHANSFFGRLRTLTNLGSALCLPTSAQWEYACRAGSRSSLHLGYNLKVTSEGEDAALSRFARYKYNGGYVKGEGDTYSAPDPATATVANGTARVGSYEPNAWGFYDMLGNVREICYNHYYNYVTGADLVDPTGTVPSSNVTQYRIVRGGGWSSEPSECRAGAIEQYQIWTSPKNIGFRVLLQLQH